MALILKFSSLVKMAPSLPTELYHHLGTHIHSSATLASLCLCSKSFKQIFTPFLYAHVHIENFNRGDYKRDPIATISHLPSQSHLRHTQSIYIGPDVNRQDHGAFLRCIEKMVNLTSLAIVNELSSWAWHFRINDREELEDGRDVDALTLLAERGALRSLQITCTDDSEAWEFPLPPFRNLRKLILEGMGEQFAHLASLAQIIIANPELEELGLMESLSPEETVENHGQLEYLCEALRTERRQNPGIPNLKLKKLRLGTAYRPESASRLGPRYIDWLTDLSVLEELTLQNDVVFEWHNDRQLWEDFRVLDAATNLRRLTLGRLTGVALDFIHRMQSINPGVLSEIAGLGDMDNDGMESEEVLVEGDELFALPPAKLGPGWRKVSLSCALGGFAQHCASVEELSCYLSGSELENFKTAVLPNLTHLHSLTIHGVEIKDGGFNSGQPLADELFRISYAAWERRGCEGERLTRVGLNDNVYGFVFPRPEEGFDLEKRRATKLMNKSI